MKRSVSNVAFFIALWCFCLPVHSLAVPHLNPGEALQKSADLPRLFFEGKDITGELHRYVSGGWGISEKNVCILTLPPVSSPQSLSTLFLLAWQKALIGLRATEDAARQPGSAPLVCVEVDIQSREMFWGPDRRIFEKVTYHSTLLDKKLFEEMEKAAQETNGLTPEQLDTLMQAFRTQDGAMWFDTTAFVMHNASVLWGTTAAQTAAIFSSGAPKGSGKAKVVRMRAPLQSSVYLVIPPADIFRAKQVFPEVPISGGWGHTQEEALIIGMRPKAAGEMSNEFVQVQGTAFSLRSTLEMAQPFSPENRRFPIMHTKDRQELITKGDTVYDRITYSVYSLAQEDYMEYQQQLSSGSSQGAEERFLQRAERQKDIVFWFDVTQPFHANGAASMKNMGLDAPTAQPGR